MRLPVITPVIVFCGVLMFAAFPVAAWAQDSDDRTRRVELATEMHKIRPARTQVEEAVTHASRNLPATDRDRFNRVVADAFDYDALEKLSIDAMADLYTVLELEKMVSYFGSAEARSIEKKMPRYQARVQPEIIRMLDAAILAERTGKTPVQQGMTRVPQ